MASRVTSTLETSVPGLDSFHSERAVLINGASEVQKRSSIKDLIADSSDQGGKSLYIKSGLKNLSELEWIRHIDNAIVAFAINDHAEFKFTEQRKTDLLAASIIISTPTSLINYLRPNHVREDLWLESTLLLIIDGFDECSTAKDMIFTLEVLRILTSQARKPIFAAIFVNLLDETSRDKIASQFGIEQVFEPNSFRKEEAKNE